MQTRGEPLFECALTEALKPSGCKVFRQLWISKSRADIVACGNGHLHVFEIKSDIDNLDRLPSQIQNYFKCSDMVSVLASERHLERLTRTLSCIEYGEYVGIYTLNRANIVNLVRSPTKNSDGLSNEVLFKMLRKREYTDVVLSAFGSMPEIPQVFYFREYMAKFCELPKGVAYKQVIKKLESRKT